LFALVFGPLLISLAENYEKVKSQIGDKVKESQSLSSVLASKPLCSNPSAMAAAHVLPWQSWF
jgi:hypothetical protein